MAENGATLTFPRVRAKVPSPSDLPTFVIVHLPTVDPGIEPKKEVFSDFRDLRRLCHIHHKKSCPFSPFTDPGVRMFKHVDRHRQCTEQVPLRRIHPLSGLFAAAGAGGPANNRPTTDCVVFAEQFQARR